MKFSDISIDESFQFDESEPKTTGERCVKVDDEHYQIMSSDNETKIQITNIHCNVKNVGVAFDSGLQLWSSQRVGVGYSGLSFIWYDDRKRTDKKVRLEDIINAGLANDIEHSYKLVLLPSDDSQRISLVTPVKRISDDTFEIALDDKHPENISRVLVVDGNSYFAISKDNPENKELLPWTNAASPIKHFKSNEDFYTNAKTLAQHEIEYLD